MFRMHMHDHFENQINLDINNCENSIVLIVCVWAHNNELLYHEQSHSQDVKTAQDKVLVGIEKC